MGAPSQLPPPRATVGRDSVLSAVVDELLVEGSTVVLGPPGIGKTNLTLAALHDPQVEAHYGRRRYFVRCEGAANASEVVAELARAMGLSVAGDDLLGACLESLRTTPSAVCLDNAETPWSIDQLNCEELFGHLTRHSTVLISMRGLELPGGVQPAHRVSLDELSLESAKELFLMAAGERFDQPALDPLLDEMGGLPLAVELLAHALHGEESLDSLARRWRSEQTRVLKRGAGDHRLLSVEVSLEASWNDHLMTSSARHLLSMLSRLPHGVATVYVSSLLPDGADAASVLRRRGLAFDEAGRLRTHPLIRHYVATAHPPGPAEWERAIAKFRHLPAKHVLQSAAALTEPPIAIEALWDGDTTGWGVWLSAIVLADGKPAERSLGFLRGLGGDIRLFNAQVPPWPDAEVAAWAGRMIADQFNVPFWFPSPIYPEEDCPRYLERHLGTPCAQCGIPLLQRGPCPWKGVCYQCHLESSRQTRRKTKPLAE
ncbi:hypothetical protein GCM10009555_061100 [Acrocarpospora macrocephala]|uniref:Uncharacterized protein n=2 Tax=Acrocarpospora macrocephala TaxID=150177 RepID=A0A5M3WKY0_9ACTN|nr:hypothetical protein Amac_031500 [Acrocarpospora macrocephala]